MDLTIDESAGLDLLVNAKHSGEFNDYADVKKLVLTDVEATKLSNQILSQSKKDAEFLKKGRE